jgi:hypothetical protein
MQAAMRAYTEEVRRTRGMELRMRVGLNSGAVVVRAIGNDLHMDYSAVGETTHLAALHQALAQAQAGHGQVVALMGEAGVGKSRHWRLLSATAPCKGTPPIAWERYTRPSARLARQPSCCGRAWRLWTMRMTRPVHTCEASIGHGWRRP